MPGCEGSTSRDRSLDPRIGNDPHYTLETMIPRGDLSSMRHGCLRCRGIRLSNLTEERSSPGKEASISEDASSPGGEGRLDPRGSSRGLHAFMLSIPGHARLHRPGSKARSRGKETYKPKSRDNEARRRSFADLERRARRTPAPPGRPAGWRSSSGAPCSTSAWQSSNRRWRGYHGPVPGSRTTSTVPQAVIDEGEMVPEMEATVCELMRMRPAPPPPPPEFTPDVPAVPALPLGADPADPLPPAATLGPPAPPAAGVALAAPSAPGGEA